MTWDYQIYETTEAGLDLSHNPPIWMPEFISWGPADIHRPLDVVAVDDPTVPYDPAINNSPCLVLAMGGNLRGNTGGGAAYPVGGSAIHTGADWKALHGRITTLIRWNTLFHTPAHAGIIALASQTDLAETHLAQGYLLVLDTLSFQNRVQLLAMTDGISGEPGSSYGTSYILLAETDVDAFAVGTNYTLALEWEADAKTLRGTRLQAFFDGTKLWDIVHNGPGSYIPTLAAPPAGSGLMLGAGTNQAVVYFDETTIAV